ncbi:uncharacterized protein LOC120277718 [Dioscorea cayenensis subsp. rotundata]|uniref:Uncharacterized protein LOC120277718 n=1 Tax=Dioscorea cayennensis subsp. rotundata TaxID=55577 RepID=A0AB40CQT9_DIOCR|nr:uncharacterized protein LOC120277718 [Dioscorea cayenensis subsp. rotundata]
MLFTCDDPCLNALTFTLVDTSDCSKEVDVYLKKIANNEEGVQGVKEETEIDEMTVGLVDVDCEESEEGEEGEEYDESEEYEEEGDLEEVLLDEEEVVNTTRVRVEVEVEVEVDSDGDVETEYARSEELQSCSSTDEDYMIPIKPKFAEFNEEVDMRNPQFKIGMKFRSFKQFKDPVKNYGIKNRYSMKFKPNDKRKYWIARNYLEQFRADPTWKIVGVIQAIKTNQEVDITRLQAYKAKCIAYRLIDGDEESQMKSLYDYRLELLKTHPGSTVIVSCTDEGVFKSFYVSLAPLKTGVYGGQLLCAVGIDGNDCIDPIAWSMVSKENRETWKDLLQKITQLQVLAQDLNITNSRQWVFMSDRQKVLFIDNVQ